MNRTPQEAVQAACDVLGSQRALATRLGVTPPTVNEWITGKSPVPPQQAVLIEEAAGVPCEETCPKVAWGLIRERPQGVAETIAANARARTEANLRAAIEAARDGIAAAERALKYNPDNASHRITGVLHALSAGNSQAMVAMQSAISSNEDAAAATLHAAKEAAKP